MPNLRRKLPSANALFVFEAAARCGNFTRAAQELYVSRPSAECSRAWKIISASLRDWIIEETRADIRTVDRTHPALGIRAALKKNGLMLG